MPAFQFSIRSPRSEAGAVEVNDLELLDSVRRDDVGVHDGAVVVAAARAALASRAKVRGLDRACLGRVLAGASDVPVVVLANAVVSKQPLFDVRCYSDIPAAVRDSRAPHVFVDFPHDDGDCHCFHFVVDSPLVNVEPMETGENP